MTRMSLSLTLFELTKAPGTIKELQERLGARFADSIRDHVARLTENGLIYIKGWTRIGKTGNRTAIFAVQPSPFEIACVPYPKPARVQLSKKRDRKPRVHPAPCPEQVIQRIEIDAARGVTRHYCL